MKKSQVLTTGKTTTSVGILKVIRLYYIAQLI